jgi:hypothetical protein
MWFHGLIPRHMKEFGTLQSSITLSFSFLLGNSFSDHNALVKLFFFLVSGPFPDNTMNYSCFKFLSINKVLTDV